MSTMRFNIRSQVLGYYVDVTIVLPTDGLSYYDMAGGFRHHIGPGKHDILPCYTPDMKFQTVYLMHGGGDDDTLPYRYSDVERYAQQNCVMLVTPNIANSFGVNAYHGAPYATFLSEELPVVIQSLFPSSGKREDNFVVGYAMGGNVALGMAIKQPERYAACIDISGGIGLTLSTQTLIDELNSPHFQDFSIYHTAFGPSEGIHSSQYDLYHTAAQNIAADKPMPRFDLVAGSDEGALRLRVMEDARLLGQLGFSVQYHELSGAHDFALWGNALKLALEELLPLRRAPLYP